MGYHGEVNVAQEKLNSFLTVAEDLQVKGLTQNKPDSRPLPATNKSAPPVGQDTKYKVSRKAEPTRQSIQASAPPPPLVQQTMYQQQGDDIQEVVPMVKTEPEQVPYTVESGLAMAGSEVASMQESYVYEGFDYGGYEGVDEQDYARQYQGGMGVAEQNKDLVSLYAVKTDSGKVSCTLCDYITRDKYNIRLHLEGKHGLSGGYQCDKCYKQLRTKQSLTQHRLHCVVPTS